MLNGTLSQNMVSENVKYKLKEMKQSDMWNVIVNQKVNWLVINHKINNVNNLGYSFVKWAENYLGHIGKSTTKKIL